jgi:hypothetical protein
MNMLADHPVDRRLPDLTEPRIRIVVIRLSLCLAMRLAAGKGSITLRCGRPLTMWIGSLRVMFRASDAIGRSTNLISRLNLPFNTLDCVTSVTWRITSSSTERSSKSVVASHVLPARLRRGEIFGCYRIGAACPAGPRLACGAVTAVVAPLGDSSSVGGGISCQRCANVRANPHLNLEKGIRRVGCVRCNHKLTSGGTPAVATFLGGLTEFDYARKAVTGSL